MHVLMPYGNNLLIRVDDADNKPEQSAGIVFTPHKDEYHERGTVTEVAIGLETNLLNKQVIFKRDEYQPIMHESGKFFIIKLSDVLGTIE